MKITDFEILYAEPSDDGKSFSARLGIDTLRQEMWLLDQVGASEKDDAIEYPIEARGVLSCDRKCRLYVQDASHKPVGVDTGFLLSADETRQFSGKLSGYVYQTGVSAPHWLIEMTLPPLDVSSINIRAMETRNYNPVGTANGLDKIRFGRCATIEDDSFMRETLAARLGIAKEEIASSTANFVFEVHPDLTIDSKIRFGNLTSDPSFDFPLTERERRDVLTIAMEYKISKLRQYEEYKKQWSYLSIPLGYERDELEKDTPHAIDKSASEKKPSREHDGFER